MGISNDEDRRLSESAIHETLPLYEEAHPFAGPPILPDSRATPDEVRDFLVQVLQARGNIGIDHARRVASRWTRGTGRELRTYPVGMYQEIFGSEDAWAVYKEVRVLQYTQEAREDVVWKRVHYGVIALLMSAFIAAVSIVWSNLEESWKLLAWFSMVFSVPFSILAIVLLFVKQSPEARAEMELKAVAWHKAPAGPSSSA